MSKTSQGKFEDFKLPTITCFFDPNLVLRLCCNWQFFTYRFPVNIAVCQDPGVPANGQRLHDDFMDGKEVTFKCNKNFDLVGNDKIRCNDGVWSSTTPECKGNNQKLFLIYNSR